MALPHHLYITGSGFDAGEFFYGCNASIADGPPGSGSRGLGPNEDALSENFNRSAYALAKNDEYLYEKVTRDIGKTEILAGTIGVSATDTITVTPSGGSGKFPADPTADVYVGGSGYSNTQEYRDLLVQLTDSDYNELLDGDTGEEIVCTAIQRADTHADIVGQGFWSSTDVEFIFSHDIPASQAYRLSIGVKTNIEDLPEDTLLNANIRGLHEAAGEVARRSVWVCGPAGSDADFVGDDCITNAITQLGSGPYTLFVLEGTYNASGAITVPSGVCLIGEGSRVSSAHVILTTGNNFTVGSNVIIQGMRIELGGATADRFDISGGNTIIRDSYIDNCEVYSYAFGALQIRNTEITGSVCRFELHDELLLDTVTVTNNGFVGSIASAFYYAGPTDRQTFDRGTFINCKFVGYQSHHGFTFGSNANLKFVGCEFGALDAGARAISGTTRGRVTFSGCVFKRYSADPASTECVYLDCERSDSSDDTRLTNVVSGIHLYGCYFESSWHQMEDGVDTTPVFYFRGCFGSDLHFVYSPDAGTIYRGNVIQFNYCDFSDVHVDFYIAGKTLNVAGAAPDGWIEVIRSSVRNIYVEGVEGDMGAPLLYMEGRDAVVANNESAMSCCILDGVFVRPSASAAWTSTTNSTKGCLIHATGERPIIRNVMFYAGSSDVSTIAKLITLESAPNAEVSSCWFRKLGTAATATIQVFIYVGANSPRTIIKDNHFDVALPTTAGGVHACIYCDVSTTAYCSIMNNMFEIDGYLWSNTDSSGPYSTVIWLDNSAIKYWRITNNTIYVSGDNVHGVDAIIIDSTDLTGDGLPGSLNSGGNDVAHNLMQSALYYPAISYGGTACANDGTNLSSNPA